MMRSSPKRRQILLLLMATLLLRVVIPIGYMPAAVGSGLLFELCPEGLPASVMQALGAHHHHHQPEADNAQPDYDTEQCPVGHMLSSAMSLAAIDALDIPPVEPIQHDEFVLLQPRKTRAAYQSRAPPA